MKQVSTGARILIADDLDLNRKLIADMLSLDGHEVDCVCDGAAAVRAAGDHPYDLILMDMIMPVMDGICRDACDSGLAGAGVRCPHHRPDRPFASGAARQLYRGRDGCDLTKPMSMDALTTAVRSWTHWTRAGCLTVLKHENHAPKTGLPVLLAP